jgi:integrase
MPKTPSYRARKGTNQAIVTLTDAPTGRRRDYWLGEHGSPGSREAYHRLIAEWEANQRQLPDRAPTPGSPNGPPPSTAPLEIRGLVREYWKWASGYYGGSRWGVRMALRVLRECYGTADAASFGPNALRIVREAMVRGRPDGERPRAPWCRKTVNTRVGHIVRMFRWAASREMVPPQAYQALQTLPPLKRGRCAAPDHEPVGPVPLPAIDAVRPHVSRQVAALIDLQLLTGARPGELLRLRACDLDTSGPGGVWVYRPDKHKNAHRSIERAIFIGPAAQRVLGPFMSDRALDAFLFSPADAEAERRAVAHAARRTPLSCGNRPGSNVREAPARMPGGHYTTASYRRAIERACDLAFDPPEHLRPRTLGNGRQETGDAVMQRLTPAQRVELREWRRAHRWHPHQLRHNAGTHIRREFGLEAAQLVLGHSSALITDAVYAERDTGRVVEVMRKLG